MSGDAEWPDTFYERDDWPEEEEFSYGDFFERPRGVRADDLTITWERPPGFFPFMTQDDSLEIAQRLRERAEEEEAKRGPLFNDVALHVPLDMEFTVGELISINDEAYRIVAVLCETFQVGSATKRVHLRIVHVNSPFDYLPEVE